MIENFILQVMYIIIRARKALLKHNNASFLYYMRYRYI